MKAAASNTLVVRSAEGVAFTLPLAGPTGRFLAWAIDLAAIATLLFVINSGANALSLVHSDSARGLSMAANFAVVLGYGMVLEWFWRGQTLGKRIMGLRVKDERGLKLRAEQVVIRNLLRAVDILPVFYLVGGTVCFLSQRNQRLGDIAAGTVVVREPKTYLAIVEQTVDTKYNSFRNHPHLEARLRHATPPAATALALEALSRRDALDPEHRIEVFAEFARYFRALAKFPEDELIGVTDEQYLRNVIDTIYMARRARESRGP